MSAEVQAAEFELIAAGLMAGRTNKEIADTLGISLRTLHRRKDLPETQQLLTESRRSAARQIRGSVIEGALAGLERLHAVVRDPDSSDGAAVSAAKYLVDLAVGPQGLAALVETPEPGQACGTCGHIEPDAVERAAASEQMHARLAAMHDNLNSGLPLMLEPGTASSTS